MFNTCLILIFIIICNNIDLTDAHEDAPSKDLRKSNETIQSEDSFTSNINNSVKILNHKRNFTFNNDELKAPHNVADSSVSARGIVDVRKEGLRTVSYIIHPDNLPPPVFKPLRHLHKSPISSNWRPKEFIKKCCSSQINSNEVLNKKTEGNTDTNNSLLGSIRSNTTFPNLQNSSTSIVNDSFMLTKLLTTPIPLLKFLNNTRNLTTIHPILPAKKIYENKNSTRRHNIRSKNISKVTETKTEPFRSSVINISSSNNDKESINDYIVLQRMGGVLVNHSVEVEPNVKKIQKSSLKLNNNTSENVNLVSSTGNISENYLENISDDEMSEPILNEKNSTMNYGSSVKNFSGGVGSNSFFQGNFIGDLIKNIGNLDPNTIKLFYKLFIQPSSSKKDISSSLNSQKISSDFKQNQENEGLLNPSFLITSNKPSGDLWEPISRNAKQKLLNELQNSRPMVITAPSLHSHEVPLGSTLSTEDENTQNPVKRFTLQKRMGLPHQSQKSFMVPPPDALAALPEGSVLIPSSHVIGGPIIPKLPPISSVSQIHSEGGSDMVSAYSNYGIQNQNRPSSRPSIASLLSSFFSGNERRPSRQRLGSRRRYINRPQFYAPKSHFSPPPPPQPFYPPPPVFKQTKQNYFPNNVPHHHQTHQIRPLQNYEPYSPNPYSDETSRLPQPDYGISSGEYNYSEEAANDIDRKISKNEVNSAMPKERKNLLQLENDLQHDSFPVNDMQYNSYPKKDVQLQESDIYQENNAQYTQYLEKEPQSETHPAKNVLYKPYSTQEVQYGPQHKSYLNEGGAENSNSYDTGIIQNPNIYDHIYNIHNYKAKTNTDSRRTSNLKTYSNEKLIILDSDLREKDNLQLSNSDIGVNQSTNSYDFNAQSNPILRSSYAGHHYETNYDIREPVNVHEKDESVHNVPNYYSNNEEMSIYVNQNGNIHTYANPTIEDKNTELFNEKGSQKIADGMDRSDYFVNFYDDDNGQAVYPYVYSGSKNYQPDNYEKEAIDRKDNYFSDYDNFYYDYDNSTSLQWPNYNTNRTVMPDLSNKEPMDQSDDYSSEVTKTPVSLTEFFNEEPRIVLYSNVGPIDVPEGTVIPEEDFQKALNEQKYQNKFMRPVTGIENDIDSKLGEGNDRILSYSSMFPSLADENDASISHLWKNMKLIPINDEDLEISSSEKENSIPLLEKTQPPSINFTHHSKNTIGNGKGENKSFMAYTLIGVCVGLAFFSIGAVLVIARFKKSSASKNIGMRSFLRSGSGMITDMHSEENEKSGHKLGSWFSGRNERFGSGKLRSNMTLPDVKEKIMKSNSTRDLLTISPSTSQSSSPRESQRSNESYKSDSSSQKPSDCDESNMDGIISCPDDGKDRSSSWLHQEFANTSGRDDIRSSRRNQPTTPHDKSVRSKNVNHISGGRHLNVYRNKNFSSFASVDTEGTTQPTTWNSRYQSDSEYEDGHRGDVSQSIEVDEIEDLRRERNRGHLPLSSEELGDDVSRNLKVFRFGDNPPLKRTGKDLDYKRKTMSSNRDKEQKEVFVEFDNMLMQHTSKVSSFTSADLPLKESRPKGDSEQLMVDPPPRPPKPTRLSPQSTTSNKKGRVRARTPPHDDEHSRLSIDQN